MDQVDEQILLHLQRHARISMTDLGKEVGLSQPAVTERVRRLEESGLIQEYRAVVSPEKLGYQASAYYLFHTNNGVDFVEVCRASPEVIECHRTSGEYNYLLKVLTSSIRELESFENRISHYGDYTTLIVLSTPMEQRLLVPTGNGCRRSV
ncbi:Lrp/AsnC family transcriptional regulator [Paenibacillus wenxiniae]|uniref:Lrp/AsnC family transcriptional regulator n=1 Tax=Paenibacillus wenxiniae TaxID=1636843 RepID=A0ABW4RES0_9BACL